jgi:hypothetical protein
VLDKTFDKSIKSGSNWSPNINIAPLGLSWGGAPGYINVAPLGLSWGGAPGFINIAPLGLSWGVAPGFINIKTTYQKTAPFSGPSNRKSGLKSRESEQIVKIE